MLKSAAIALLLSVLWLSPSIPVKAQTAETDAVLAHVRELAKLGKHAEARSAAETALRSSEARHGKEHPVTAKTLIALAEIDEAQGRFPEAQALYKRALDIFEKSNGPASKEAAEVRARIASVMTKHESQKPVVDFRASAPAQADAAPPQPSGEAVPYELARGRTHSRRAVANGAAPSEPPPQSAAAPAVLPVPPARPAPPDQSIPMFPWPPPASSASYVFPHETFDRYATVGEVSSAILSALERSGYLERSFFETPPGGIALVTRLERIGGDGSPAPDRWPLGFKADPANLADFLRGLFYVKAGYYRVIVFVLQDIPFSQSSKEITGEEAKAWLRAGANTLPGQFAVRPFGKESSCTALIYEFESDGSTAKMVESALPGKEHLEKAGLLAALATARRD